MIDTTPATQEYDVTHATDGGFWGWMHHLLEECFVSGARFDRGVHRDAVARVVAGESATAVARDVGCRRGTVSQWCREAGWSWSGGVRAGLLRLTRPDAPESSRPSWVGRACPRPQPPLGCVGSRRAGTGTIRPWRQHQQHQHGSRGGAPTACRAAPARDGSGAASVSVTLSGFRSPRAGPAASRPRPSPGPGQVPSGHLSGDRPWQSVFSGLCKPLWKD